MLHHKIQREIVLYRGGRIQQDLYMDALSQRWAQLVPNFTYIPVLSEAPVESNWQGRTGLVHQAVLDDFPNLNAYQAYVSGAPGMVEIAHQTFVAQGLNADEFFSDAFTFAPK